jgi:hypothetical protein
LLFVNAVAMPLDYARRQQDSALQRLAPGGGYLSGPMKYDENRLAQLAATVAAGLARDSKLMADAADKFKTRAQARELAKISLMVARHIMVAAHCAAQKVDELELLYDDADFL